MSRKKNGTEGKIWLQAQDRWAGAGRECRAGMAGWAGMAGLAWMAGRAGMAGRGRAGVVGDVRVPT